MTDVRREWISKRAYTIWEDAGRPHGRDNEHWDQAERERDDFERLAATAEAKPATKKPLIEISGKTKVAKDEASKPKKKAASAEKAAAAKTKSPKAANSKPI